MKRQAPIQTQKETMPPQMRGHLPHAAVRATAEHDIPSNVSAETRFGHDFSQVAVRPSAPIVSQDYSNASCPLFPQRCPFGGACHTCPPRVKAKLKFGQPGDKYEQEADRVAEQVMRMPKPKNTETKGYLQEKPLTQRRVTNAQSGIADVPAIVSNVLRTTGRPLNQATRGFMEPRFNHDFSQVKIHNDSKAEESANAVSAKAYTVGQDIVFGADQYAPGTTAGNHLLAHELTHVVQQSRADFSIVPKDGSETGDSTLQKNDNITTDETVGDIPQKTMPKLSADLMLQRAACPCCSDSISISNISQIDNATYMGHSFDAVLDLQYPVSGPSGSCTLEWWERTNVPAIPGHAPNTWTDMYSLYSVSPTFNPWRNRSEACGTCSPVTITDPPSLGKRPGRTVTRTLEFRIVINSMPPISTSGCTNASQQVTATQVLTMVNGAPNWGASSFTTP